MRKRIHSFTLLLFAFALLLGAAQDARASHLLGGDMTYVSLGNNQYRVRFRLYRDCTGILPIPGDFVLSCRNGGNATPPFCNVTASVTATFVQQGAVEAGNPFCAAASAGPCQGPTGLPNYDVYNFLATVTLPPGNWNLSTNSSARPALANAVAGNLYVEATLDNRNQGATAVANNSPRFDPQDIPIQYVCWKQPATITYSSIEDDGDSLVYSLAAPLQGCGSSVQYNPFPDCLPVLKPIPGTNPTCYFSFPGIPGCTYSATNPIRLGLDTVGTCPVKTGVARTVRFNQQARTMTFNPGYYDATAGPGGGGNKYQLAVLITEYRRINGVRRVIGTVRREANVIVIDCGTNRTPNPVQANPITVNSGTNTVNTTDTTRIDVRSCNYSRVELDFTDPDNLRTPSANQILKVTLPADINTNPNLLDSGDVGTFSLSNNNSTNPKGVFFFQPSPNTVGRIILLNIKIEDDNCPIKGIQNRVVVIRIIKGNVATALATVGSPGIGGVSPPSSICLGGTLTLQGNVQRPDSIRRIATNTTQAQVYTFQWTTNVGGNGLPAVTNTPNIVVNPTVTTRYKLAIAPTLGFSQGACGDTTSILVKVVSPPVATATPSDSLVCAGAQVTLTGLATRSDGLNDVYSYTWTGADLPTGGTTGPNLTVRPTTLGVHTYNLAVAGASPYACAATTTVRVTVVPPPTVTAVLNNAGQQKVCAGTSVALTANAVRPAGAGSGLPDTYTYTWTGPGLAANTTGKTLTVSPTALGVNTYTVTATGKAQYGCSNTATVDVTVVPPPTVTVTTNNAFVCPNGTATLTASATNKDLLNDVYTYTWTGGNLQPGTTGSSINVRPTANTTYTVTATGSAQSGCAVVGTVRVQTPPALAVDFTASEALDFAGRPTNKPPVKFNFANTTSIAGQAPGSTFTYFWTYQRYLDALNNPITPDSPTTFSNAAEGKTATLDLDEAGTYKIVLTGNANLAGGACATVTKERLVVVPDVTVPNIITPNGDGQNDVFKVSTSPTSSKLEIFNRWGRKVYEQNNYANNWGGNNQPAGVYYYLLTKSNGAQTKGWIEVVK
jgi:gliding motility-associated-like protein